MARTVHCSSLQIPRLVVPAVMLAVMLAVAFLASCATVPPGDGPVEPADLVHDDAVADTPPEWITTPFDPWDTDVLIVGYGAGDSPEEAYAAARSDVAMQMEQVLVQRLDHRGTAVSPAIAISVEDRAAWRSTTLPATHEHRSMDRHGPALHILVRYREADITEDLEHLAPLPAAVTRDTPRDLPRESPAEHSVLQQLETLFLRTIPESPAAQEALLEEMLSLASQIVIRTVPGEMSGFLGSSPGNVRVDVRERGEAPGVLPEALRAVLHMEEADGHAVHREESVPLNSDGTAQYEIPAVPLSGVSRWHVAPGWFMGRIGPWEAAVHRGNSPRARELLRAVTARLRPEVTVRTATRARSIPTAVIIMDADIAGNPIATGDATRGAYQFLVESGFRAHQPTLTPAVQRQLMDRGMPDIADLYDLLPFEILAEVERVIIGTARIMEFREDEGITVQLTLAATAYDVRREQQLVQVSFEERVTGGDPRTILRTAFSSAGRRAARHMAVRLP